MSMIFMKSSTVPSISSYPSAVYSFSTFLLSSFAYTFRLIIALFSPFVFEKGDDIRAAALMVFYIFSCRPYDALTVTAQTSVKPPSVVVTVMIAVPFAFAVTTPVAETSTFVLSLEE